MSTIQTTNIKHNASASNNITLDSAGSVGIGTATPAVTLDVNGNIRARAAGGEGGELQLNNPDNATVGAALDVSSSDLTRWFTIRNNSTHQIGQLVGTGGIVQFFTAGTERVRIDGSGNVGIGTSSPGQRLQVSNSSSSGFAAMRMATDARAYDLGIGGSTSGFQQNNWYIFDVTANATRLVVDSNGNLQFNSGYGSAATAFGCRAWVNFNGTGTIAIRGSGNVSSISDNGTGDYTVNITTAMPDANYATVVTVGRGSRVITHHDQVITLTSSAYRFTVSDTANSSVVGVSNTDTGFVAVSIFR